MPTLLRSSHHTRKRNAFPYQLCIFVSMPAEYLLTHTLTLLRNYRIPADHITLIVHSATVRRKVLRLVPPSSYSSILVGGRTDAEKSNTIFSVFPIGTYLVCIKDTVTGFIAYDPTRYKHQKPLVSLLSLFRTAFDECHTTHAHLWGTYPIPNGYSMKQTVSSDLRYIPGTFWGCINPGTTLSLHVSEKEDYERSILFYKQDGAVVRINSVAAVHPRVQRNPEAVDEAIRYLCSTYPEYVYTKQTTETSTGELRLKHMRQTKKLKQDVSE